MASTPAPSTGAVWPAADFALWPQTRYTALVFNAAVLLWLVIPFLVTRRPRGTILYERAVRWGFLVTGVTSLSCDGDTVEHTQLKAPACCCCLPLSSWSRSVVTPRFRRADIARVNLVDQVRSPSRQRCSLGIIVGGCILGLWLHFVPCLWWTCDWGPHDGQQVRGGIWFLGWPVLSLALMWHDGRRWASRNFIEITAGDGRVLTTICVFGSSAALDAHARLHAALVAGVTTVTTT